MRAWSKIVAAVVVASGSLTAAVAQADPADETGQQGWCERTFDAAQRSDMESFRDFDAKTWREGHAPHAISIFPTGQLYVGIEAIMKGAERHFTAKDAVWSWTELSRHVDGCKTAVIVYDATYDIPRYGYHQRALTTVSYVFDRGHWRSVTDQGTLLEKS